MGHIVTKGVTRLSERVFSPDEEYLYNVIRNALYRAGRAADADALAAAVVRLDPDLLEQALLTVNADAVQQILRDSITAIVNRAALAAASEIQPMISATPAWGNAYTVTGKLNTEFKFDANNPAADLYAEMQAGRLVTAINESMRLSIRQIIAESFSKQISVDYTARRLRQVIGLHPRWAKAVDKYFIRQYESLVRSGVPSAKALEKTERLTDKYRQRLIRARAWMIARTEIQMAQNWGRQLSWQQAVDGGWVDPVSQKQWVTAYQNNQYGPPCDRCWPMNGETVRWNGAFSNGLLMPPAHPHCRCTAILVPPSRGLNDAEYVRTGIMR